jgi:DNA-binding response OmpR family regulator
MQKNDILADQRILVIEDDVTTREFLSTFLHEVEGCEAVTACDTREAINRMANLSFQAIILDIFLPGENGLIFLKKLKKLYPKIPVLILTGAGYEKDLQEKALENGASSFVSKMAGLGNMLLALRNLIRK